MCVLPGDKMKIKRSFKKHAGRSVIYGWIISYLAILSIPVLLSGIVYYAAKNIIETEIAQSNQSALENIRSNLDDTCHKVKILSAEVAEDPSIEQAYQLQSLESSSYYTLYQGSKQLSNYKVMNESLQGYYIYLDAVNVVLSPGAVDDAESFFNQHFEGAGYTAAQWIQSMRTEHKGDYEHMPYEGQGTDSQQSVAYVHSMPIPLFDEASANLVMVFDFHSMLHSFVSKDSTILVLNSDNQILAQDGRTVRAADAAKLRLRSGKGVITGKIGKQSVVVSYITSGENDWKFVTITPMYLFWKKSEFIRNLMMAGLLLCMILGGLMAYYFARRNYNPIRGMVDLFRSKAQSEPGRGQNEFSFIRDSANRMIREKEQIQTKLEKQNDAMRSNLIESLLLGRRMSAPATELMSTSGVSFPHSRYWVMTVYIEGMDETIWDREGGQYTDPIAMAHFVLTNVVGELIRRHSTEYMAEVDDMMVCLINTDLEEAAFAQAIRGNVQEAADFIERNFRMELTFAVSGSHDLPGIQDAYNEALTAMEYSRLTGKDELIFYADVESESSSRFFYPTNKEHKLINFVKAGDSEAACRMLEDIFTKDLIGNSASLATSRFLMLNLVGSVVKSFSDSETQELQQLLDSLDPVDRLMHSTRMVDLRHIMFQIITEMCRYCGRCNPHSDKSLKETIEALVGKNYADPEFGIGYIAGVIGKSPYYTSKIFKEQTGQGILDYISRFRIEQAKRLLKTGGANQAQIAQQVGFTNVRTFQRVFKKLEGVPPGHMEY